MTTIDSESTIVGNTPTSSCTGALTRPLTPDHHKKEDSCPSIALIPGLSTDLTFLAYSFVM